MWLTGRRARPSIADAPEVVAALGGTVVEGLGFGNAFWKLAGAWRDIPDEPVGPGSAGGVRVVGDEGQGLSLGRCSGPLKGRRDVVGVAGVALGDGGPVGERGRCECKGHGV